MDLGMSSIVGGHGQLTGFSLQDLAQLNAMLRKSLEAGYGSPATAIGALTGGQPLIPQSIEATLAVAEFQVAKEVKHWARLVKTDIFSSVHEFTRVNQRGLDFDPFVLEGQLPPSNAGQYERLLQKVKYLADYRVVTDQMQQMRILGGDASAMALEDRMGTQSLLGRIESSLFWADSRVNAGAWDGLQSTMEQFAPANISDLRGEVLTEEQIRKDIAEGHERAYIQPEMIWTSYTTKEILSVLRGANQRYTNVVITNGQPAGIVVDKVPTSIGPLELDGNLFIKPIKPNSAAVGDNAPTVPAGPTATAGAPGVGETSLFLAADAGNYIYRIVAVGPKGKSAPVDIGATAVVAGQKVTISIGAGTETGITYYEIYRSTVGGAASTATKIGAVAWASGAAATYTDLNEDLPGTTWAFAVTYDPSIYKFVRLLDLMRRIIPFPGLAFAFAILLFGAPLNQVPTKLYAWKNVGQST